MTNKQALAFIERQKFIFGGEMRDFLNYAEKLVKKDTPMKPRVIKVHPECENSIYGDIVVVYDWVCGYCQSHHTSKYKSYRCSKCGQVVDWNIDEEVINDVSFSINRDILNQEE